MAFTTAVLPNPDSHRLLQRAVDRSQRRSGVQLHPAFIRSDDGLPPLARMLRGGRSGEVRLKLYLSLCLLATDTPFDIRQRIPARSWAAMLALHDPDSRGARRIADALRWLDDHRMVKLAREAGSPPRIQLLSQTGSGGKHLRPKARYVSVPLDFWRQQWITWLSGSGVALLLVLLELQGGKREARDAPTVSRDRRDEYGLSGDTWTRATKELSTIGLLTVGRISQGDDFERKRMRNTYWIDRGRFATPPAEVGRDS